MRADEKILGVGLRGAGQVAREHAWAVQKNPHLTLAGVSSRSIEKAKALRDQFDPGAKVYEHFESMLSDPAVDIVVICTPNHLHAKEAIQAFEAGKHLILEKPVAINDEELANLRRAARRSKSRSVVSFVLRWHPLAKNLKTLLEKNAIGEIYFTEVDYWHGIRKTFASYPWIRFREYAGGAMITGGCHAADMARYLTGKEADEVFAYSCRKRDDFDYETTLVASVKFKDGTVGKLSASLDGIHFPYQFHIHLLGTEGMIRDNRVYSKSLFPQQDDFVTLPCIVPSSGAVTHHPFQEEVDQFVDHILYGTPVLCDVLEACRSQEIVLAIEESARTGRSVKIIGESNP